MKNSCIDCRNFCCLKTEMILSEQDIKLIINNSSNDLKKKDFVYKNRDGFFQLKNIEGHCVFFDIVSKNCKIYEFRPKGCQFYPLIYDYNDNKCVIDDDCQKPHYFYQNQEEIKIKCQQLIKYLRNEIKFNI